MGPFSNETKLAVYLTQYLKVASGDRVYLAQRGALGLSDWFVFKCKECTDNWHVGVENFKGLAIPQVLQDWVKKHRHVCNKYVNTHGVRVGICSMCGWPYGAHEISWWSDSKGLPPNPEGKTLGMVWVPADKWPPAPAPPEPKEKPLPTFKGRKFRETLLDVSDTETD
jgi:hypothetical protein